MKALPLKGRKKQVLEKSWRAATAEALQNDIECFLSKANAGSGAI